MFFEKASALLSFNDTKKFQSFHFEFVIIFFILMTLRFDLGVILLREMWCLSPLGISNGNRTGVESNSVWNHASDNQLIINIKISEKKRVKFPHSSIQYIAIGKTDLFYNSMGLCGNFTEEAKWLTWVQKSKLLSSRGFNLLTCRRWLQPGSENRFRYSSCLGHV